MPIDRQALEDAISQQHERQPFSGVIFVRDAGETILARGFGFANKAEQIPNSLETRFGMASGGKTFTGVAICQLVERGLAAFETPLKDCLETPLSLDPAVTLHHLLTHTSGIPDYFDESVSDDYAAVWRDRPMYAFRQPADYLPLFAHLPMQFKPGEGWAYSNAGFIMLGLVVEHLSGMPFADYVEKYIFQPCGMASSGYFSLDQLPGGTAQGYIPAGNGEWRTNIYAIPIVGSADGGTFATVRDLSRFWDALMGGQLVGPAALAQMLAPHWLGQPTEFGTWYGYGLRMKQQNGSVSKYYMLGGDPGVAFFSGFYPASRTQYSLIGNTEDAAWAMYDCIAPILNAS